MAILQNKEIGEARFTEIATGCLTFLIALGNAGCEGKIQVLPSVPGTPFVKLLFDMGPVSDELIAKVDPLFRKLMEF